jgi:transcriptional regulator with XRE-family HTH domain
MDISPRLARILEVIRESEGISQNDLAAETGIPQKSVQYYVGLLEKSGDIHYGWDMGKQTWIRVYFAGAGERTEPPVATPEEMETSYLYQRKREVFATVKLARRVVQLDNPFSFLIHQVTNGH